MPSRVPQRPQFVAPLRLAAALTVALVLSACGTWIQPYRTEIQQGNFVSREMLAMLKTGMTHDQVRFTLGSPMVQPVFRADQWDYVFYQRKTSGELVERRLTLSFENDRLARWTGDEMPSELPATAEGATNAAKSSS
jgi:outer membrane protein assembly factor BamE